MTSFKLIGAALVLAAFAAAPSSAQEAISEPGAYSFYHPNGDVLNAGASSPSAAMGSPTLRNNAMAQAQMSVKSHRMTRTSIKHY